jgi:hypothetical protein
LQQNNSHETRDELRIERFNLRMMQSNWANPWWSTIIEFTRCVELFRRIHPNICPSWTDTHGFCGNLCRLVWIQLWNRLDSSLELN